MRLAPPCGFVIQTSSVDGAGRSGWTLGEFPVLKKKVNLPVFVIQAGSVPVDRAR